MSSFTQLINFIMELIDLIKKFFNSSPNDDQQQDEVPPEE